MKSLDYVQQPDGSFRWEMAEMDEAAKAPAVEPEKPARRSNKKAISEPVFVDETPETPEF